jgi:hypothetical protein
MDERRTLSILGWTMASLVMAIFVLNAVSLSALEPGVEVASISDPPSWVSQHPSQ